MFLDKPSPAFAVFSFGRRDMTCRTALEQQPAGGERGGGGRPTRVLWRAGVLGLEPCAEDGGEGSNPMHLQAPMSDVGVAEKRPDTCRCADRERGTCSH